jgi:HK97 family phage prohead protease
MPDFPTADLIRMVGTLHGYAAVFNEDTVIDSWEGRFIERIAPGAFKKTLKERGDKVKVLFNHGFDPQIGDKPLGKPSVQEEDDRGLKVEVPLDDTSYNRDLVASLRSGALDGMSFRFSVSREEWEEDSEDSDLPVRTLRELKLYEYGPVTFPAYEATTAGVRGRDAYQAYRQISGNSDADTVTSEKPADTPPIVAPVVDRKAEAAKLIRLARVASASTHYLKEDREQEIA